MDFCFIAPLLASLFVGTMISLELALNVLKQVFIRAPMLKHLDLTLHCATLHPPQLEPADINHDISNQERLAMYNDL